MACHGISMCFMSLFLSHCSSHVTRFHPTWCHGQDRQGCSTHGPAAPKILGPDPTEIQKVRPKNGGTASQAENGDKGCYIPRYSKYDVVNTMSQTMPTVFFGWYVAVYRPQMIGLLLGYPHIGESNFTKVPKTTLDLGCTTFGPSGNWLLTMITFPA